MVLAAQRPGVIDPLASTAGLSHKCLVPIDGAALIVHVVAALQATPGLTDLRIVIEPEQDAVVAQLLPAGPVPVSFVPAADNLADSVLAGARGLAGRVVVTTADNVLLTAGAVEAMTAALAAGADVAVAMARQADVLAAHPEGQRRFYRFRDDAYSNCNLYAFAGPRALAAAELFRGGGQFAKKPRRLIAAAGLLNVILMAAGRLTLAGALARLGRRVGLTIAAVRLEDGAHAIDVDNPRTYAVAAELLARRREGAARDVSLAA